MNITAISSPGHLGKAADAPGLSTADTATNDPNEIGTPPPPPDTSEDSDDSDNVSGVLRHLEEGHFKGVADVRLRINFFEELSARAAESGAAVSREQAGGFVAKVNGQIDTLIAEFSPDEETQALVDELRKDLDAEFDTALEEFAKTGDDEALTQVLQASFETFVARLRELLVPPPPPEEDPGDSDPTDPVELAGQTVEQLAGTTEPTTTEEPADDPFAALLSAFKDALSSFLGEVRLASQLPDLSPPSGNGVAYEKFLAIYNELLGISNEVDEVA